jgi:signal transduction histidine kinase
MRQSPGAYRYGRAVGIMTRFVSFPSLSRLGRFATIDSRVKDVGFWFALSAPLLTRPIVSSRPNFGFDISAAVLALILLLVRRQWPIPSLMIGLVAAVGSTVILQRPTVLLPITFVLLFTVAVVCDRRIAIAAGLIVLFAVVICVVTLAARNFLGPLLLAGLAWPTLAVAAGNTVKTRREALIAAEDRAAFAEATREDEAQRRVIEERLHIARELHDVIAHKIAVVNVQAGVASHLLRSKPDDAATALATIRTSAREVLDELAGLLGVLRTTDDEGQSTEPTPTLDDIPALVDSFQRVGLHVTFQTSGKPQPVSDSAAIAAYRTVQEALTNAHKHGDGNASLRISHEHDDLTIVVSNKVTAKPKTDTPGYGLVGMRERVFAAHGRVNASEQPDGTFLVTVSLPNPRTENQTDMRTEVSP